jgi:Type III restriction enzyme, res subunit
MAVSKILKDINTFKDLYDYMHSIKGNSQKFKKLLDGGSQSKDILLYCTIIALQLKWMMPWRSEYYSIVGTGKFSELKPYEHPYQFFIEMNEPRLLKISPKHRCIVVDISDKANPKAFSFISLPSKSIDLHKALDKKHMSFLKDYPKSYITLTNLCVSHKDVFDDEYNRLDKYSEIKNAIDDADLVCPTIITKDAMLDIFNLNSSTMLPFEGLVQSWLCKGDITYRPHQYYAIEKTKALLADADEPLSILWGHIARSGKSYMMYGLVEQLLQDDADTHNYLIITTAPNETIGQYMKLFNRLSAMEPVVNIISAKDIHDYDSTQRNVIILSKQYLTHKHNEQLELDNIRLIMIDEAHYGGTTSKVKTLFDNNYGDIHKIFVTATYTKVEKAFEIDTDNTISWDLEDIVSCKTQNSARLIEKYPNFDRAIRHTENKGLQPFDSYKGYPQLTIVAIDKKHNPIDEPDRLLALEEDPVDFVHPSQVKRTFKYIFNTIVRDLDKVNDHINQRPILNKANPSVIVCFVPWKHVSTTSRRLRDIVNQIKIPTIAKDGYHNLEICECNTTSTMSFKANLNKSINQAINGGKSAVFVISGAQGHLGITIEQCDLVILAGGLTSSDFNFQAMFRSMTEAPSKSQGYVIDLSYKHSAKIVIDYAKRIRGDDMTKEQYMQYMIANRIVQIVQSNSIGVLTLEDSIKLDAMFGKANEEFFNPSTDDQETESDEETKGRSIQRRTKRKLDIST